MSTAVFVVIIVFLLAIFTIVHSCLLLGTLMSMPAQLHNAFYCAHAVFTACIIVYLFLGRSCQKNAVQLQSQLHLCKHEPRKESVYDEVELTENQVEVSRNPAYAVMTKQL